MTDKTLVFIGLAARAGKLIYGSDAGSLAIRQKRVRLVIMACDASDNTKKLIRNKCFSNGISLYEYSDIASLGKAVGKGAVSVISVTDNGFAKEIINKMGVGYRES